jgi:MSHA biogenesis protein MshP
VPRNPGRARGFSIVAAIFLVVVLALLGVFIVNVVGLQQSSQQLDVRGVRAYQAARAGVEWAAWQSLDPNSTGNPVPPGTCGAVPTCPASPTTLPALAGSLAPFTVVVSCAETATTEGNREVRVFAVTSTATAGTPGNPDYVSREVQARFSKCHDPTAAAPRCACG